MLSYFNLNERNTTIQTEFIGGLTTFLTMAYIIFVNPAILSETGMDNGALITVTCLVSFIGTVLVGLWANMPFAMAPGMGLNAFFTYTIVLNEGIPWQSALGIVFLSGFLFLILALFGAREKIAQAIPAPIKIATGAGIGLFIAFIGLKNLGLIEGSEATFVTLAAMKPTVAFGLIGLIIVIVLELRKVKGAILVGVLITTLLGLFYGDVKLPETIISAPPSIAPIAFQMDITSALQWSLVGTILSFMFVDLFDSIGTIVACSYEANMVDEKGQIPAMGKVLQADALATSVGALLGTSTTTTYIESGSGIAAGARTGLSAIFTGAFFLLALFFTPIIGIVPAYATAPALIMVGIFMFKNIRRIQFDDLGEVATAFITMLLMPLTYSISTGLLFGFLAYILISIAKGETKQISAITWGIGLFCLISFFL